MKKLLCENHLADFYKRALKGWSKSGKTITLEETKAPDSALCSVRGCENKVLVEDVKIRIA